MVSINQSNLPVSCVKPIHVKTLTDHGRKLHPTALTKNLINKTVQSVIEEQKANALRQSLASSAPATHLAEARTWTSSSSRVASPDKA